MKKLKIRNSIASALLAVMLIFNTAIAFGAESTDVIFINTEDEFLRFAEKCSGDSFSRGKTFELTADLDFTDRDFKQVPIFSGEFNGNGYSINGIKSEEKGSNQGVFRYIDKNATVKDLKVNGVFKPKGSMVNIGLVCGTNRGTILRCYTDGYVKGETNIGGIVGVNEEDGVVEGCISNTAVYGNQNTGGVAGKNKGLIKSTTSKGFVNTDADRAANNSGGITGNNVGTIEMCYNYGNIGYNHSGYNVGGVAGIQSGKIISSYNYANVSGRKDVGGIVGQFEPYITMAYGADKAEKLKSDLKNINNLANSLTHQMNNTVNEELNYIDNINGYLSRINDILNERAQSIYDDAAEMGNDITYYMDDIDTVAYSISAAGNDVQKIINRSQKNLESATDRFLINLENAMTGKIIGGETSSSEEESSSGIAWPPVIPSPSISIPTVAMPDFEALSRAITDYIYEVNNISSEMSRVIGNSFSTMTAGIADISSDINSIQHSINNVIQKQSDELSDGSNELNAYIDMINNEAKKMSDAGKNGSNSMQSIFDSIKNQIDAIIDDISEMLKVPEFEIKDISEIITADAQDGEIRKCQNFGIVKADANVGGIAGIMAKELSNDPEEDLLPNERKIVDTTALFRALILESSNNAQVITKNECGGGIVGKQDTGAVYKNINKGKVSVETGEYCGGIAGLSNGNIVNCFVQSTLVGNDSVGGIAGKGNNIKDSYVMAVIESEGEKIGSVAGDISGNISNNYFVYEGHHGVDGINYEGQATAISYDEFKKIEEIPANFFVYRINFIVNGNTIKTVPVEYGGSITKDKIPHIPEVDGYYGQWEDFDRDNIRRTTDVNCIYTPYITTISYGDGVPEVLVEGKFSPEAEITFTKLDKGPKLEGKDYIIGTYNTYVEDSEKEVSPIMKFRIRCTENANIKVFIRKGDIWEDTGFTRDGSYLVVNAPNGADISIVRHYDYSKIIKQIILVVGLIIFVGGGGYFVYRYNRDESNSGSHKAKKAKKVKEPKNKNKTNGNKGSSDAK